MIRLVTEGYSCGKAWDHKERTEVTLRYPDEFLTSVKGTYCPENYGYRKLISIEFGTNLGRYGPFGKAYKGGAYFDFQMGNHRSFGGFYGTVRNGALESIGVYVKPITSLSSHSPR